MIRIEFHTSDSQLQDLAQRYWRRSDSDAWSETVELISESTGFSKNQIPKLAKEAATAYLEELSCSACSEPSVLLSRSDFLSKKSHARFLSGTDTRSGNNKYNYLCHDCLELIRRSEIEEKRKIEINRANKINSALDVVYSKKFDFSEISFIDAVYCYVIKMASGLEGYSCGEVIHPAKIFVTQTNARQLEIFKHLFEIGVLVISKHSPDWAFEISDGNVKYFTDKVFWEFAHDINGFDGKIIESFIESAIDCPNVEELSRLWHDVAEYECEAYFFEVCERWGLNSWIYSDAKRDAIKYTLLNYSIPQVWNFMFYATQGLGAEVNAGNFNKKHIENMFPGNIRRRADKSLANSRDVKPWDRRKFDKECYLTSLVFDRLFGGGDLDWKALTGSTIQKRAEEVVAARGN